MFRFLSSFLSKCAVFTLSVVLAAGPVLAEIEDPASAVTNEEVAAELREMRESLKAFQATIQKQNQIIERPQQRVDDLDRKTTAPPPPSSCIVPPTRAPAGLPGRATPSGLQAINPEIGML